MVTLGLAEALTLDESPGDIPGTTNFKINQQDKIKELEENTLFSFISTNVESDSRIKNFSCVKI